MAYNYFPMNYPYYGYPQTGYPAQYSQGMAPEAQMQMNAATPGANQNRAQTGIIWVQGEAGAKAYPVAPGTSQLLMDSESECFYIKTTDASGMPLPLRTFSYKEIINVPKNSSQSAPQNNVPQIDTSAFVTRAEFNELKQMIEDLTSPSKGD